MFRQQVRTAPWVSATGAALLLLGVIWDAAIHQRDPLHAAQENPLTLANPAHQLLAVGLALSAWGAFLLLLGHATGRIGVSTGRRLIRFLPVVGLATLSIVGLGVAVREAAAASAAGHQHNASGDAARAPTAAEHEAARGLIEASRSGAARFADFATAQREGYSQITPYPLAGFGPARFHNRAYAADGRLLDPSRPEDLVYLRLPSGRMVLLGVMYLAPPGQGPRPAGQLTDWHRHENLCFGAAGMLAGRADQDGRCPNEAFLLPNMPEMLHLWWYCGELASCFAEQPPAGSLTTAIRLSGTGL